MYYHRINGLFGLILQFAWQYKISSRQPHQERLWLYLSLSTTIQAPFRAVDSPLMTFFKYVTIQRLPFVFWARLPLCQLVLIGYDRNKKTRTTHHGSLVSTKCITAITFLHHTCQRKRNIRQLKPDWVQSLSRTFRRSRVQYWETVGPDLDWAGERRCIEQHNHKDRSPAQ